MGDPVIKQSLLPDSGSLLELRNGAVPDKIAAYVHIPFCTVRCGYCDFNTYTATELRGLHQRDYPGFVHQEIVRSAATLKELDSTPSLSSIFFGGGTPTLLSGGELGGIISVLRDHYPLLPGAEVSVEANPDTVTPELLASLRASGVTRISLGMQSAVPHVLKVLERSHDPARLPEVVAMIKAAGLTVSVDLIYGAPGESLADWQESVSAALALEPDHISAYSLIVEPGTKLARQIRRGEHPEPDPDLQADMYELAEANFSQAGFNWYEVSNWTKNDAGLSHHNLNYWNGGQWWGFGPGAHSFIGGVRWWNVRHPAVYAQRLAEGLSPAADGEVITEKMAALELVMLRVRLAEGISLTDISPDARQQVPALIAQELIDGRAALAGQIRLTLKGRLLADAVVRALTEHSDFLA